MKTLLRFFLINLVSLWITTQVVGGLTYSGGIKSLLIGALVFAAINLVLVPLLKILLLPLNLLTLGVFTWIINVLALYALITVLPSFKLQPYQFPGFEYNGFTLPQVYLTTFWVAVLASFLIGVITHFLQWISH